jgi:hypothetical protein
MSWYGHLLVTLLTATVAFAAAAAAAVPLQ